MSKLIVDVTSITDNNKIGKFDKLVGIQGSIHYIKDEYNYQDKLKSLLMYDRRVYDILDTDTMELLRVRTGICTGKNNRKYLKENVDFSPKKDIIYYVHYYEVNKNSKGINSYQGEISRGYELQELKKYLTRDVRSIHMYDIKKGIVTIYTPKGILWEGEPMKLDNYIRRCIEYRKNGYKELTRK